MSITNEMPFYQRVWLITELSRTDNRIEIKNKFKRIFKQSISDLILNEIVLVHGNDIKELRQVNKLDMESHEWANPRSRMEKYQSIAKLCEEGFPTGALDIIGQPVIKKDPQTALKAVQACGKEQNDLYANELKLLQILVSSDSYQAQISTSTGGDHMDAEIVENKKITTDTDQFFD